MINDNNINNKINKIFYLYKKMINMQIDGIIKKIKKFKEYKNNKSNQISINYKIYDNDLKIFKFGEKFVENNKKACKMV